MGPNDTLLEVVDLAYRAALEPDLWPEVLGRAIDLVRGDAAALLWKGHRDRADGGLCSRLDPSAVTVYFDHFVTLNPIQHGLDRTRAARPGRGVVLTDQDCVARSLLERSPIYNDFMRPYDLSTVLLVGGAAASGGGTTTLNLFRADASDEFGEAEMSLGQRLNGPLANAFEMAGRLGVEQGLVGELRDFIDNLSGAILLVAPDGRIVYANAVAEAMLAAADGLGCERGRLKAGAPDADHRLARLIGQATADSAERRSGGALALPRRSGRRPLALLATPARGERRTLGAPWPLALVSVIDPEANLETPHERLSALFGFTPAEARIASRLIAGEDQAEIAEALGLSLNTVKVQVARIRAKTETSRQGEFISLVLRALGAGWA